MEFLGNFCCRFGLQRVIIAWMLVTQVYSVYKKIKFAACLRISSLNEYFLEYI